MHLTIDTRYLITQFSETNSLLKYVQIYKFVQRYTIFNLFDETS